MKNPVDGCGGSDSDAMLYLDDLTVLLRDAQEDPFQDIEADVEPEGTLLISPEEWLAD